MSFQDGQLSVPGHAIADPRAVEMVRAWIANQGLHCSLRIGYWEDVGVKEEKAWGMFLADVVRHVADALAGSGKVKSETVAEIRKSFLAELDRPTSSTAGDFVDGPSRN